MRNLIELTGKSVDARTLPTYTWNSDLIYIDGPMLSLFKQEDGADVLFCWLDCDEKKHRWGIIPVDRDSLWKYLSRQITLRSIFLAAESILVFNTGKDHKRRNFVRVNALPDLYLPSVKSFLRPEISTDAAKELIREDPKKIVLGIDGELYLEDLAGIPKLYQQLYSFHYGMEHLDRAAVRHSVERLMGSWRGGINSVNLFSGLKAVTPSIHRASLSELKYNSPGRIAINMLPSLAEKIKSAMDNIIPEEKFTISEELYQTIYRYFREHKISGFDDERGDGEVVLLPNQVKDLTSYVHKFFDVMAWDEKKESFSRLELNPLSQLRMLLAYYRRLRNLRVFVVDEKLFLTPRPEHLN